MRVAEIYADMSLNIDRQSLRKAKNEFNNLGKIANTSLEKPIVNSASKIESSLGFIAKSLKGFLVVSAVETAFKVASAGVRSMNDELSKSIDFVNNIDNLATALGLSFKQTEQLNLAAVLGNMNGAQDLYGVFSKFQESLGALKNGDSNETTKLLASILGNNINKQNDLELFGRLISYNKYLDKGTVDRNIKLIFGLTTAQQKKFLSGDGYDKINEAYDKTNYYTNDNQVQKLEKADQTLKLNAYKNNVDGINKINVIENLKVALDSSDIAKNMKETKNSLNGILATLTGGTNTLLKELTNPSMWDRVLKNLVPRGYTNYTTKGGK